MSEPYRKVEGRCPMGCGDTLFLSDGGYVSCSWYACPRPEAASTLLDVAMIFAPMLSVLDKDKLPSLHKVPRTLNPS